MNILQKILGRTTMEDLLANPTCEICGVEYLENCEDDASKENNIKSILETERCVDCYEEWGLDWPDRI